MTEDLCLRPPLPRARSRSTFGRICRAAAAAFVLFASCGDGTPAAPPPALPLSWNDVPESLSLKVGESKTLHLSLTSAVTATYSHSASNARVSIAGESPRAGIYEMTITGVEPGDSSVSLTASAPGYASAAARLPVMVEVRPLSWSGLPARVSVRVGERRTVQLRLTESVRPDLEVSAGNGRLAADGDCPAAGRCDVNIFGIEAGPSSFSVRAITEGYQEAAGTIPVDVAEASWGVFGIVSADGGPDYAIVGATVTATNRDTGRVDGRSETGPHGFYAIGGLRGDRYAIDVAPPARYRAVPAVHVNRPASGVSEVSVDFTLPFDGPDVDSRFRRQLWNELAFDAYECPGAGSCPEYYVDGSDSVAIEERVLYILDDPSPNFYIRTGGFSQREVRTVRATIPGAVSDLTGEPFFGTIEEGSADRDQDGWITVQSLDDDDYCGRAWIGRPAGGIWINPDCPIAAVTRHEIGHAMGFFHAESRAHLMNPSPGRSTFSATELYHTQLAYQHWRYMPYFSGPWLSGVPTTADRQRPARPPKPLLILCPHEH